MTDRGLRATITIDPTQQVGDIRKLQDRLAQLDGASTNYDLHSDPATITVLLRDPQKLSVDGVPAGSHSFAEGWIMALNVQYITNLLGEPVEWEELVIEHGRVKELKGKFMSTVMAIREHIQ